MSQTFLQRTESHSNEICQTKTYIFWTGDDYKKCPTSASVLCCDLLYFVLFFSSEEQFICKYRNYRF